MLYVVVQSLSHVRLSSDPTDCSPPGLSVRGILQARVLEWVVISVSRGSSRPGDRTCASCMAGRFLTTEPPGTPVHPCSFFTAYVVASTSSPLPHLHPTSLPHLLTAQHMTSKLSNLYIWKEGSGRSPGERDGNPLQYSDLKNPMNRRIWFFFFFKKNVSSEKTWCFFF